MRATFNKDITSGILDVDDDFITVGPSSVFHIKNELPEFPEPECYIRAADTCSAEQYAQVINGTVLVKDWIVLEYDVGVEQKVMGEDAKFFGRDGSQKVLGLA